MGRDENHARLGYEMLNHSAPFWQRPGLLPMNIMKNGTVLAIHGLAGEDIHIYGRITAVADVFDALGSDRCYKKAWNCPAFSISLPTKKTLRPAPRGIVVRQPRCLLAFATNTDAFDEDTGQYWA